MEIVEADSEEDSNRWSEAATGRMLDMPRERDKSHLLIILMYIFFPSLLRESLNQRITEGVVDMSQDWQM